MIFFYKQILICLVKKTIVDIDAKTPYIKK